MSVDLPLTTPLFRATHLFPEVHLELEEHADGVILLQTGELPTPAAPSLASILVARAAEHGDKPFVCARDASGEWERISYAEMRDHADHIAGSLARQKTPGT